MVKTQAEIKSLKNRQSYGQKLKTRLTVDFDTLSISRFELAEIENAFRGKKGIIIDIKLQDTNKRLEEFKCVLKEEQ